MTLSILSKKEPIGCQRTMEVLANIKKEPEENTEHDKEPFMDKQNNVCQICNKNSKSLSSLWKHIHIRHFRNEFSQKFGNLVSEKQCVLCGNKFSSQQRALLHLSTSSPHYKLNTILKEQGLVPLKLQNTHKSDNNLGVVKRSNENQTKQQTSSSNGKHVAPDEDNSTTNETTRKWLHSILS